MKTLVKHTIPILVILIWIVLAVIITMSSCTKDQTPGIDRPEPQKAVQKIVLPGPSIDLSLSAYSSLDVSTAYDLSVDRRMLQSFRINQNENMKWRLESLSAGAHRINIYTRIINNQSSGFSSFLFTASNGTDTRSVIATRIDQYNYAIDLVIE